MPEDQKDLNQEFDDRLFAVLKKYCDANVLQKLHVELDKLRTSDASILEKAKNNNQQIKEHGLIEQNHLQIIILYCQERLSRQDGINLELDITDLCVAFSEHSTAYALYANIIGLWQMGTKFRRFAVQALQKRAELYIKETQWEEAFADLGTSKREFITTKNNLGIAKTDNTLGIYYAEQGKMEKAQSTLNEAHRSLKTLERST